MQAIFSQKISSLKDQTILNQKSSRKYSTQKPHLLSIIILSIMTFVGILGLFVSIYSLFTSSEKIHIVMIILFSFVLLGFGMPLLFRLARYLHNERYYLEISKKYLIDRYGKTITIIPKKDILKAKAEIVPNLVPYMPKQWNTFIEYKLGTEKKKYVFLNPPFLQKNLVISINKLL